MQCCNAQTKRFIERIRSLARTTRPDPPLVLPPACTRPFKPVAAVGPARSGAFLNGTYRYVISKQDALAHGDPTDKTPAGLAHYPQVSTQILQDGKWLGGWLGFVHAPPGSHCARLAAVQRPQRQGPATQ